MFRSRAVLKDAVDRLAMIDLTGSIEMIRENPPLGVRFHPGHTWVRLLSYDLAFVGTTDFAVNFVGELAGISLPGELCLLRPGDDIWALSSEKGRKLTQVAPIGGLVLAVNSELLQDVGAVFRSPYRKGWLVCLQAVTIPDQMRTLFSIEADRLCLDHTCSAMESILESAVRLPFQNARWSRAFGDEFSDGEWEALRKWLFPVL